jgi:hypothetical protein
MNLPVLYYLFRCGHLRFKPLLLKRLLEALLLQGLLLSQLLLQVQHLRKIKA